MMKLTKMISLVAVAVTLGVSGAELTTPTTAQAKTKYTLKTFPKAIRGSWYTGSDIHSPAVKFKSKKMYWRTNFDTRFGSEPLHQHKLPFSGSKTSYKNWIYAKRTRTGAIYVNIWPKQVTYPMAGSYKLHTKKYKGHNIKVLYSGRLHFYRTKTIARHFNGPTGMR
ncbi:hypothetical protein C5L31_001997 [Secundilactobacillus malefermentans]|uniref:DUF4767 domain-containing protein n=2 Tax=Secundilactobacillus malefermentans TaxID=176292 RepID=A0A4R5NGI5_9LACO|nr:hypothetical protein FD44_GL000833 [Secundilactobacillus malefermentans DSM 5705 = KCTC 3548]TDG73235.1 hypothetical protein C5L31_001997 [Secundilactobacillus malefermentans]